MFFKKYLFGDTAVYFIETPVEGFEGKTTVGFAAYPKEVEIDPKKIKIDSLVQAAFTGDEALVDYSLGVSMRNRDSSLVKVVRQTEFMGGTLNTYLTDGKGNEYVHRLRYDHATGVFTVNMRYENRTKRERILEALPSLSLGGISAPASGTTAGLKLHRMTSAWSRECRLKTDDFAHMGLEMSWARYGVKSEKWFQLGSMPNRGYYPFGAIEDPESGIIWAAEQEAPFSWQAEVYEEKESCSLSCGLADYETGHWRKKIPAGGSFTTENARFVVTRGGIDRACNALVREADRRLSVPESEESMPVLYNEYCATWGNPSAEKVEKQLAAVAPLGVKYFVIDCGWYRPEDKGWNNAVGDWYLNQTLFPDLRATVQKIREKGMKAGIWFEFEVTGRDSEAFRFEDVHLHRGGAVITSKNRRFLDLRNRDVSDYLNEKLLRFLREYGFEYLKIDYNDSYGVGCDGAESVGEGGRKVAEESLLWLDKIKETVRDIVIENCSSGGSRIEPLRMGKVSMCSFSDAHECPEIPLVAANVSRVVPARQMQVWAVIRRNEEDARTIYSLCAAMMGRICLSGEINPRKKEKYALIRAGLDFYESVKEIVRRGEFSIDCDVTSYREPVGRQIYTKDYRGKRLVIVHRFKGGQPFTCGNAGYKLVSAYTDMAYSCENGELSFPEGEEFRGGAFLLEREDGE